jgi:hypothetical protein
LYSGRKAKASDTLEAIDAPPSDGTSTTYRTPESVWSVTDSLTVNGYVRPVRTLLFWAASEQLIDERIPRRIKPPKRTEGADHPH